MSRRTILAADDPARLLKQSTRYSVLSVAESSMRNRWLPRPKTAPAAGAAESARHRLVVEVIGDLVALVPPSRRRMTDAVVGRLLQLLA
jgi:hypothetical protein